MSTSRATRKYVGDLPPKSCPAESAAVIPTASRPVSYFRRKSTSSPQTRCCQSTRRSALAPVVRVLAVHGHGFSEMGAKGLHPKARTGRRARQTSRSGQRKDGVNRGRFVPAVVGDPVNFSPSAGRHGCSSGIRQRRRPGPRDTCCSAPRQFLKERHLPGNVNPYSVEDDQNDPARQRFATRKGSMKNVLGLIAGNTFPRGLAQQKACQRKSQQSKQPNRPAEVPTHSSNSTTLRTKPRRRHL